MNDPRVEHPEALDVVLRQWTLKAELPPRFQEQVWQRIARAEAAHSRPNPFLRLIESVLPRPRVAIGYLAVLLALGVAAGSFAAQIKTSHLQAALGVRYVQSLDPYRAGESPR